MAALLVIVLSGAAGPPPSSAPTAPGGAIVKQLRALEPLPKTHYTWGLSADLLDPGDPRLYQIVRITHTACLRGEWDTSRQVEAAVMVCRAVNSAGPAIRATLGINYSPWGTGRVGTGLSPKADQPDIGRLHEREVAVFRAKLVRFQDWLAAANRRHQTDIRVSALLLDCEQFRIKKDDNAWNAALTERYNEIYDAGRKVFPAARIEWFGRGLRRVAYGNGWDQHGHFTLEEKADSFSCSLYCLPEIGYMRETFRRTYELARAHAVSEVTPWVALGAGWRRQADTFHRWAYDWDYDPVYSWQLGRELNRAALAEHAQRYAPWSAAKVVMLYPPPFNPRTPSWAKHFIAYVRGAHDIRELPPGGTAGSPRTSPGSLRHSAAETGWMPPLATSSVSARWPRCVQGASRIRPRLATPPNPEVK